MKIEKNKIEEICKLLMEGKITFDQLSYAENFKNIKNLLYITLKKLYSADFLKNANEDLRNNKKFILGAINRCNINLKDVGEELKNDKEVVLAVCKNKSTDFQYAS